MSSKAAKYALFAAGSAIAALALIPDLAAYAPALTGIGGVLVGWSGLKRPGDQAS
jgi:hypothetical protein